MTVGISFDGTAPRERRLAITYRPIAELRANPTNPRLHGQSQIRSLTRLIKRFGFAVPVLIDGSSMIIAGHARVEAARAVGLKEIPTILLGDLTPEELQAFVIADNRIAELSTWDDEALAEQLRALSCISPSFDLELTGFETPEIDFRIERLDNATADEPDPADAMPEGEDAAADEAVTEPGDLWLLGPHKILCGDALDEAAYARVLGDERAAGIFTDPPYNVRIDGNASGLGATRHRDFAMASGEMSEAEFTTFLATALGHLMARTGDGAILYCCMDWRHLGEMLAAIRAIDGELLNVCVWEKHNAGMGSFYRSAHELVFVLKRRGSKHINNVQLGRFGRNRTNVWHYRGANDFGRGEGEGNLLALHPTVKPVAMIADALMDSTKRGALVLDPFLGSGSTLIAAERTGRRCCGIEIDPRYVDTAIRRWQAWTRDAARHAASGLTFEELTQQRRHHRDE